MLRLRRLLLPLLLLALFAPTAAQAAQLVKMGTLVPAGSAWEKILKEMGADWQDATGGEVNLRIYPGGVAGDDPDLVRKMRIGQLHAAALTVTGLMEIDPAFEVFEIPMFFDSHEELFHALEVMRPVFEKRLEEKGYILLNWGHGGWVYFFSKEPVRVKEDLRPQKIFTWAGNETMAALWRDNGFQAVPLASTDIMMGLQTGMFDVLPTTPLAALTLQWYRSTPHMQNLGLAPFIGGTVVSKRAWSRISPEHQQKIREAARAAEKRIFEEIPGQDDGAIQAMKERGLNVVDLTPEEQAHWREAAAEFAASMGSHHSDEMHGLLDQVRKARDEFRAGNAAEETSEEAATESSE